MVDFLKELPRLFVKRYLNTHGVYLKSIADIIAWTYHTVMGKATEKTASNMVKTLLSNKAKILKKKQNPPYETLEFRNLRNCWYHECALNYPIEDLDERLKFASWKIIECYYAVFSSIAALVRCWETREIKTHNKMINIYAMKFLRNSKQKMFVLPPTNLHLNQQGSIPNDVLGMITWKYAHTHHIPNIKKALNSVRRENHITTIPHYLKGLREWATYQDAYLLVRLYGETIKKQLDFSLSLIAFIYCLQTEYYLIELYGWDSFEIQYDTFISQLEDNLGVTSQTLKTRFNAYIDLDLPKK